jgi:hypothetical protein
MQIIELDKISDLPERPLQMLSIPKDPKTKKYIYPDSYSIIYTFTTPTGRHHFFGSNSAAANP